jgi:hypothetical protein
MPLSWDDAYTRSDSPPWDIDRPQPAFVALRPWPADRASAGPAGQDELREAFRDGWAIDSIEADTFEVNPDFGMASAQAWRATIQRK